MFDEALSSRVPNNTVIQRPTESSTRHLKPRMDVYENAEGDTVTASFELPGLKKEDVSIDVHDSRLTVSGETGDSSERGENGFAIRERHFGRFSRTIQLPQGIKEDAIKASMEDGLLTITFPKSAPEAAPKKITIT